MKSVIYIFCIFILNSIAVYAQDTNTSQRSLCVDALTELVNEGTNETKLQRFLTLQADLTLHKLVYSMYRESDGEKSFQLENEILEKIKLMNATDSEDEMFKKVKENFENNPLSRKHLAGIMPYIKEIINNQIGIKDKKWAKINSTDIKLLATLGESELRLKTGQYDYRFLKNRYDHRSIINMTSMINDTFKSKKTPEHFKKNIANKMKQVKKDMFKLIETMQIPEECTEIYSDCTRVADEIIDDEFLDILLEVTDQANDMYRTRYIRYGDISLDSIMEENSTPDVKEPGLSINPSQVPDGPTTGNESLAEFNVPQINEAGLEQKDSRVVSDSSTLISDTQGRSRAPVLVSSSPETTRLGPVEGDGNGPTVSSDANRSQASLGGPIKRGSEDPTQASQLTIQNSSEDNPNGSQLQQDSEAVGVPVFEKGLSMYDTSGIPNLGEGLSMFDKVVGIKDPDLESYEEQLKSAFSKGLDDECKVHTVIDITNKTLKVFDQKGNLIVDESIVEIKLKDKGVGESEIKQFRKTDLIFTETKDNMSKSPNTVLISSETLDNYLEISSDSKCPLYIYPIKN